MRVVKLFIGGLGDAWFSRIIARYAADYAALNPGCECSYHSWYALRAVRARLAALPADAHVTLVGHSYGADTALHAARARAVDVLIGIDPVGRLRPAWATVRPHARLWLNIRAEPSSANRTTDDTIAAIGGKHPRPPAPGQPGAPDHAHTADVTHGAFRTMMRAGTPSGQTLLGGRAVG